MSGSTFPSLPGLGINVSRTPVYATNILTSASGKEQRASYWSTPRYRYTLALNFVRQANYSPNTASDEMATLIAFIDSVKGAWDTFYFTDPYDSSTKTVRFEMDEFEFERIVNKCWDGKTLKMITVK